MEQGNQGDQGGMNSKSQEDGCHLMAVEGDGGESEL